MKLGTSGTTLVSEWLFFNGDSRNLIGSLLTRLGVSAFGIWLQEPGDCVAFEIFCSLVKDESLEIVVLISTKKLVLITTGKINSV